MVKLTREDILAKITEGECLRGANLRFTDLTDANLRNTNLSRNVLIGNRNGLTIDLFL